MEKGERNLIEIILANTPAKVVRDMEMEWEVMGWELNVDKL